MTSVANGPRVLDGVAIAAEIKAEVADHVASARKAGYTPGLAVVLVGEVPASQI
jgi:methylenetetrahydrofolate dehydrogenase (NADP+)/methenyltetrahydrofolate cyclohydrolase